MRYSNDGQGLHRSVDAADGNHYVYGHLFLDAAPRVFGCFDQPDLKAPYDVRVTTPVDWVVVGNGAATGAGGQWTLATTRPLSTYFVTVCAGPYVSVHAEHDTIPLGIHARASLKDALERHAEQMLEVTRQSLDYYHSLFGIRYPFGEYHQVFVPEFNAGAMENPGCVTLRDQYLFRGPGHRGRDPQPFQHHRPRVRPHVVRRPGDHDVVGRPVAERVVRRVHVAPHAGGGDRSSPTRGWTPPSRARSGATPPSGCRPRTRSRGRRRRTPRRRCRTSTASPTPRARRRCAS